MTIQELKEKKRRLEEEIVLYTVACANVLITKLEKNQLKED